MIRVIGLGGLLYWLNKMVSDRTKMGLNLKQTIYEDPDKLSSDNVHSKTFGKEKELDIILKQIQSGKIKEEKQTLSMDDILNE